MAAPLKINPNSLRSNLPSLEILRVIKHCVEAVPLNLTASDTPETLRALADALDWVDWAISTSESRSVVAPKKD